MNKFAVLISAAVVLSIGIGDALAQGHRGGGSGGGGGTGVQGGRGGGGQGYAGRGGGSYHGSGGNWHGGSNWGGRGGAWHGHYRGYYGRPWYGGWRYPYAFGYYPYYYPYSFYPPYPVYADAGPPVYIERPRVVEPPPPAYAEPEPPRPRAVPTPERLERFTLSARELFEFDRYKLRVPQPKLDEIASVLSRNPQIGNVKIIGYTDRLGTDSYNLRLSQRRADAVKSYLVNKGVAPTRLTAIGRGKADPVVQCSEKMARAELIKCLEPNRRVVVEEITVERRVPAN